MKAVRLVARLLAGVAVGVVLGSLRKRAVPPPVQRADVGPGGA